MPLNDMMYRQIALNVKPHGNRHLGKVACITLGCAKNQVDSEILLGTAAQAGYEIVTDLSEADFVVVNTCGFLGDAMEESIDSILAAADCKSEGKLRKLIVAGCMVPRYGVEKLREALPEADAFISPDELLKLPDVLAGLSYEKPQAGFIYDHSMPRIISSGSHRAYVKVSDGCDRMCAFCMIPYIKGKPRSRSSESILAEIKDLGAHGIKEVNLIAQDLTAYGLDNNEIPLHRLLRKIDADGAVPWIRLLYGYPVGVTKELMDAIVELPSVCEYLDVPLQHSAESVLKRMNRPVGKYASRPLVEWIKTNYPQIHLRTTFIVGFPGETEADFADLEKFVAEGYFDSVGVFPFSPEEGVPAAEMSDQIPDEVKKERNERLMAVQQKVLEKRYASLVGQVFDALIEGTHEETDLLLVGRTRFQAPEVDGVVIINDSDIDLATVSVGSLVRVEITESAGYDLIAKVRSVI